MDYLSNLPIDIFIKSITYLPFEEVISVCNVNKKLYNYCNNYRYNNHWKKLTDDTFNHIYNYETKLTKIWNMLGLDNNTYNYLVYTNIIKDLDPITQLMIYYKQNDMANFNNPKIENIKRFLALFLLNDLNNMKKYSTDNNYDCKLYIDLLEDKKISKDNLNKIMTVMSIKGSVKGIDLLLSKGAEINESLSWASLYGNLDAVKYLVEHGANIHANDDYAMVGASERGHLEVIKYLLEHGANIHADDDNALNMASVNGHLEVVKYLVENGSNIDDYCVRWASNHGYLDIVKYLVEKGANIDDNALLWASKNGHLDIVKYLVENGANIHANDDYAIRHAKEYGRLNVVRYLRSL